MKSQNFRQDINGLRAWAVTAVVLFHFGIPGFSGGYAGVDVFFVISGFLMTSIIYRGLSNSDGDRRFSIGDFYLSRARRILPALIMLCLPLIVAGWFLLSPEGYRMLATHAITAVLFVSNIRFNREAGYFDVDSHEKLLLHTWSLSVEWQFYLLFPLILVLVWKLWPNKKAFVASLIILFTASLATSVVLTSSKPSAAFFLLPSRAWEMIAGGLVFMLAPSIQHERAKKLLEASGLALILLAITLCDANTPWPGSMAIIPVTGAMLVLASVRESSLWTGTRVAQWLGTTSYSLYLWHWPFSAFLVYRGYEGQPTAIFIALILTGVCTWLSWRYIEEPVRHSLGRSSRRRAARLLLLAATCVAATGGVIRVAEGVPSRLPEQVTAVFAEANNKNPLRDKCHVDGDETVPECTYGGDKLGVIVIGDSHAASVVRSAEKALPSDDLHVLDWTIKGCRTISQVKRRGNIAHNCGDFVQKAIEKSHKLPSDAPILIVNRLSWTFNGESELGREYVTEKPLEFLKHPYDNRSPEYIEEMTRGVVKTACAFAQDRPTYMLRPFPEMKVDVPRFMGRALLRGEKRRLSISVDEYEQRHALAMAAQDLAAQKCGVKILDLRPYLCEDGRCWGDRDGMPIYYDADHPSERGAALLIPLFQKMFQHDNQQG